MSIFPKRNTLEAVGGRQREHNVTRVGCKLKSFDFYKISVRESAEILAIRADEKCAR
jgi:hypothetical protein